MKFTNNTNIPLPLAVWLLHDAYDYIDDPNYISATSLLKPIKSIILGSRVNTQTLSNDISEFVYRTKGTAYHDSIEKAWQNPKVALSKLGLNADKFVINPSSVEPEQIPVYMEQRTIKQIGKWNVGGKFDMILDGQIYDFKSTSAYAWIHNDKDNDYILQMSLYKWLNPEKVIEDFGTICFIFTDWNRQSALSNPKYPQKSLESKNFILKSLQEIDTWVKHKLNSLENCWDQSEDCLPRCTDEELWKSQPIYKYYKDSTNTQGRSTKNFDNEQDALLFKESKGTGVVIPVPGEPKRCGYCPAAPICKQRMEYFND